jgi:MFS family permease
VANRIVFDLNGGQVDKSASVLLVTIWELGEAVSPFFVAPLSETYGRYPVFNAANILFISALLLAALCQTTPLFVAARAFTGLAVASNVLNPAIIADIFPSEDRGAAMSLIMIAPLTGGAIGPAICGAIVQSSTWRNILWMSIALAGACELAFLLFLRETYKVVILRRRAAHLRRETDNPLIQTEFDEINHESGTRKVWNAVMRPSIIFVNSGVLQAVSLFGSVAFAYFYVMSTTLPDILEDIYHLEPAQIGSAFICFSEFRVLTRLSTS